MQLWYQSFVRPERVGPYQDILKTCLVAAADPGTAVAVHGIARGAGVADEYRYLEYLDTGEVLENAVRAERQGFDAFLIGNIGDPGIDVARELVDIPVLGLCETSLHVACLCGRSVGLVALNDKHAVRLAENIRRAGLGGRITSVEVLQVEGAAALGRAFSDTATRRQVLDAFDAAAGRCARAGAEVIVPAGGVLMVLLADLGIGAVDGTPILDGVRTLVKMGEMAVKLQHMVGWFTSKRASYARPSDTVLDEVRALVGHEPYPSSRGGPHDRPRG